MIALVKIRLYAGKVRVETSNDKYTNVKIYNDSDSAMEDVKQFIEENK
jgi:hypothetical protein